MFTTIFILMYKYGKKGNFSQLKAPPSSFPPH